MSLYHCRAELLKAKGLKPPGPAGKLLLNSYVGVGWGTVLCHHLLLFIVKFLKAVFLKLRL